MQNDSPKQILYIVCFYIDVKNILCTAFLQASIRTEVIAFYPHDDEAPRGYDALTHPLPKTEGLSAGFRSRGAARCNPWTHEAQGQAFDFKASRVES